MAMRHGRLMSAAELDRIVETRIRRRRHNFPFLVPLGADLSRARIGEIFVVRSWELDCDHTTSISENWVSLEVRPVVGIPHRREERVWVVGVIECGLDALGVVGRWYCRAVIPLSSKWLPYRISRLEFHFNERFFQFPSEIIMRLGVLGLFLPLCFCEALGLG